MRRPLREKNNLHNYFAEYLNRLGESVAEFTLRGDIKAVKGGIFIAYIHKPMDYLTVSAGIRTDYFSYNKHFHLSPRLTTTLYLSEKTSLAGSLGIYYQTLPLYLLYGNEENRKNKDPLTTQFCLSLNYNFNEHTRFSISIYNNICSYSSTIRTRCH